MSDAIITGSTPLVMSKAFELTDDFDPSKDSAPKASSTSADSKPTPLCALDGCTNNVTKPVKGPSPKYCDEHRGAKNKATTPRISAPGWPRANEIEKALTRYAVMLGGGISFINETDGAAISAGGPAVVHELIELAKTDRRIRRYLEIAATPGKYGPLVLAALGMVLPILANHGMVPQIIVNLTSGGEE